MQKRALTGLSVPHTEQTRGNSCPHWTQYRAPGTLLVPQFGQIMGLLG
ncbi:MAG TPA: hypothetical protein VF818_12690 [Ktedonobacterales bacterium]